MAFTAECSFCRLMLEGVPDEAHGASVECPRCKNRFTLAAMIQPRKARRRLAKAGVAGTAARLESSAVAALDAKAPLTALVSWLGHATSGNEHPRQARAAINHLGVLSFFFGTFSLLFASLPTLTWLVLPMAATGVFLGSLGLLVRSARNSGVGLPGAGLAVSVPVMLIAIFWPDVLGLPGRAPESKPSAGTQTVYHFAKGSVQHEAPRKNEWIDAGEEAIQQNGMRVRVTAVLVKAVELKDGQGRRRPGEICLLVKLRVSNASVDRRVDYGSWGESPDKEQKTMPRLTDDSGKEYRLQKFEPGWTIVGHVPKASLPTAKWVDDVLVFQSPARGIAYLRLELPGAAVGLAGKFQFEIPRRMISFP
ncbi:MAG TPA: hypothetical protein VGY66_01545 [Gemmataceae bacterium]|jgi:hypothetical protein|nr:hypothetical protein [Gemmataceae bacterium]